VVQNKAIPKSFISLDEFKNTANAALKERFKKESYQVAKAQKPALTYLMKRKA
jgi:hypothetical protein